MRIVSLVPSVTETLMAWGIPPIACTRFCEQPALTHIGGTKDPDVAAIVRLQPELVIMDAEENRREDHEALLAAGLDLHTLDVRSLGDVDTQVGDLASRLGVPWTPVGPLPAVVGTRSAFVPIWRRPWMALGSPTYGTSLLESLGVANVLADAGPYPSVGLEEIRALRPDVVVAPSEPYPFSERHRTELAGVAPPVFVDGRDLLWWGIRTRDARSRLAAVLAEDAGQ